MTIDQPQGIHCNLPGTVTVPGDLPVSIPLPIFASEPSDRVHCVPEVTSCVVPSLRWAAAFNTAAPPTSILVGVAVTVRDFSDSGDGLAQPAININRPQMSLEQISRAGGKRIDCLVVSDFGAGKKAHVKEGDCACLCDTFTAQRKSLPSYIYFRVPAEVEQ
jgi:hypothetical protein